MAFTATSYLAPQFQPYKFYWIKFYEPGTTTLKAMSLSATGVPLLAKAQINNKGFIETAGAAIFIPFVEGAYDAYLFPNETDADNNDTSSAIRIADNITPAESGSGVVFQAPVVIEETITLAQAGQTRVTFTTIDVSVASFDILDAIDDESSVDRGPLKGVTDYSVFDTLNIDLVHSYPTGSRVRARQNESLSTSKVEIPKTLNDLFKMNSNQSISVWGHRCLKGYAPENTIEAAMLAMGKGVKIVEHDVQWTSDGVPILMHDTTIDRTTNGTGIVTDKTLAELQALDAGSWFSATYAGAKVPKHSDFIDAVIYAGGIPLIEIKAGGYTDSQLTALTLDVKSKSLDNGHIWFLRDENMFSLVRGANPFANIIYFPNTQEPTDLNAAFVQRKGNCSLHLGADYTTNFDFTPYSFPITALNVPFTGDIQAASLRGFMGIGSDYFTEQGR